MVSHIRAFSCSSPGVPPFSASMHMFNQATKPTPLSSGEIVNVVKNVTQEFKCTVLGTKPEAFIQWTFGGTEQLFCEKISSPSLFSPSLVDTTCVFQFVPTLEHHLQHLSCKTVLPMTGGTTFIELIIHVTGKQTTH